MKKLWKHLVVATLAAAFVAGAGAGPVQAAPTAVKPATAVSQTTINTLAGSLAALPAAPAAPSFDIPVPGSVEAQRSLAKFRAIVGAGWGALKTAVRAGLSAFLAWFARQPKAIRWALRVIASPTQIFYILLCLISSIC